MDMTEIAADELVPEYEKLIARVGMDATDERICAALFASHEWTEEGARAVLALARTYGVFILRNALALAAAMEIEDGSCGL
jgi:hypothetical protein